MRFCNIFRAKFAKTAHFSNFETVPLRGKLTKRARRPSLYNASVENERIIPFSSLPAQAQREARDADSLLLPAQVQREARNAGVKLVRNERGLALTDGTMVVRADFSQALQRLTPENLNRELVVRAARIKGANGPLTAVDATAGLGEDSLLLAAYGFSVVLFEQNPVIAALLQDAIDNASATPELAETAARMKLVIGDSAKELPHLDFRPDVVLLDPMFPERRKSAAVKKKLQLLQRLEKPCDDEAALLDAAFAARPRKIIVKRPVKGPHLAGRKPDYSLAGKAIRFDCHTLGR